MENDVKPESGNPLPQQQGENTDVNKKRVEAEDKTRQDAGEQLPEGEETVHPSEGVDEIHELVQGQKLEQKFRGGGVSDVDEYQSENAEDK